MFKGFTEGFKQGYAGKAIAKPIEIKRNAAVKNPVVPPTAPKRKFKKRYIILGAVISSFILVHGVGTLIRSTETPEEAAVRIAEELKAESERIVSRCKSDLESNMKWETKQRLRDPDSFESRSFVWLAGKKKDTYEVIMTYNARNGFGGMNQGMVVASAVMNKDECALKTINFPFS